MPSRLKPDQRLNVPFFVIQCVTSKLTLTLAEKILWFYYQQEWHKNYAKMPSGTLDSFRDYVEVLGKSLKLAGKLAKFRAASISLPSLIVSFYRNMEQK